MKGNEEKLFCPSIALRARTDTFWIKIIILGKQREKVWERQIEREEIESEKKQNENVNERYLSYTFVNSNKKKIKKVRMCWENESERVMKIEEYVARECKCFAPFPLAAAAPSDLLYT